MSMIKLLTAENQQNEKIYEIINKLFRKLKNEDWIKFSSYIQTLKIDDNIKDDIDKKYQDLISLIV